MMALTIVSWTYHQPYIKAYGIDIKLFGLIYLLWLTTSSIVARCADVIDTQLGFFAGLAVIPLGMGMHLFLFGSGINTIGFASIFLGEAVFGFIRPAVFSRVNRFIGSGYRATILSLEGLCRACSLMVLSQILACLGNHCSVTQMALVLGAMVLVVGGRLLALLRATSRVNASASRPLRPLRSFTRR